MAAIHDRLIRSDQRPVLVGLSGGLDSVVLVHALAATADRRQHGLRAIHVDHGLHADARLWASECQRVCDALALPLAVVRVEVERHGDGPEAAARRARHLAFESELGDDEVLALAHHQYDQAETFLLRALRGSGPDGLGAMRLWRSFGRGWLWRPWLNVPRSELLAYAHQHGLQWIDDPGNADVALDRNFLRHRVLPLLRERWPRADAAFARSAGLNAEAAQLLEAEDAQLLARALGSDPQTLDIQTLALLPVARRARVLRRWIIALHLPPLTSTGIARIQSQLLAARPDTQAEFTWAGAVIRRWRGLLYADIRRDPLPVDWHTGWNGASPLDLPTGDVLRLESAGAAQVAPALEALDVVVHARRGGERITLPGRSHTHAFKHVLQELGVPPWVRARLPLLSDKDGRLVAAGDLVCSAGFDRRLREQGARLRWDKVQD